MSRTKALRLAGMLLMIAAAPALGQAIKNLQPGGSFEAAVESLQPGDTLIVHAGTYSDTGRISIGVKGTAAAPVLIKAADGEARPIITRPAGAAVQNTINIEGATYLAIRGLEIIGNGGDGINLSGTPSNITIEDNEIHDIDVGINFRSNMDRITVRRNHIHRTGIGGGTGEGMYVGCNDATCVVSNALIEGNWIHDALPGTTQGDGIEVKVGSHSNVIRGNVIYNMPYPGIFVYGTNLNTINIVEENVIWNCLEGIYAVADAIVRNNIILSSARGLSLYGHVQVGQMKNVTVVNNTLYDNGIGVDVRWGSNTTNMVLANNAVYSPGKTAINSASGINAGATVRANYIEGATDIATDNLRFFVGGSATSAFVNPAAREFWPPTGSPLIGMGVANLAAPADFNQSARAAAIDVGAYESDGKTANPGWKIVAGFKPIGGAPSPPPPGGGGGTNPPPPGGGGTSNPPPAGGGGSAVGAGGTTSTASASGGGGGGCALGNGGAVDSGLMVQLLIAAAVLGYRQRRRLQFPARRA
ncbi:MAG: nitrous oxide reductase family maturation protein NosD [Burkholderiales bacterium]